MKLVNLIKIVVVIVTIGQFSWADEEKEVWYVQLNYRSSCNGTTLINRREDFTKYLVKAVDLKLGVRYLKLVPGEHIRFAYIYEDDEGCIEERIMTDTIGPVFVEDWIDDCDPPTIGELLPQ